MTLLAVAPLAAPAQDVEGSKDHPMFTRVPGYQIGNYDAQDFAKFEFGTDPSTTVEGKYWRIEYNLKEGAKKVGPLQIARNHTDLLVKRGGKRLIESVSTGGGTTVAKLPIAGGKNVWVQIDVNNDGDSFFLTVIEEAGMEQQIEMTATAMADALRTRGSVSLHGILFDTGKSTIKPESGPELAQVGELLKNDPALKLEIQGHTDNTGVPSANLQLSQQRAVAVKAYLVQQFNIAAARLTTTGLGATKPVADNATEAGKAQNRRVELVKKP
jgi:outer membrane protein OmpA-like peptidoglycan-associated protein